MKTINAKITVCPEPTALLKAEISRGETELEVLLDNPVSASSAMRFLESSGFSVHLKDDEGTITISARKGEQPPKATTFKISPSLNSKTHSNPQAKEAQPASGTFSVLITGDSIGSDRKLGETLMKSFLNELQQMEHPPAAVALMNDGVKLALYDSSTCDHLKNLEKKGASILVCGACANYFNILDQIGAGSISGMPEIIETLNASGKIMTF